MSKSIKKFFTDFKFWNLDDVEVNSPDVDQITYYDKPSEKWKNGDTSNVTLFTPKVLNKELFIPANRTAFFGSFRSNGFRVRVEGRLRVH